MRGNALPLSGIVPVNDVNALPELLLAVDVDIDGVLGADEDCDGTSDDGSEPEMGASVVIAPKLGINEVPRV